MTKKRILATDLKNDDFRIISSEYKIPNFTEKNGMVSVDVIPSNESPLINYNMSDMKLINKVGKKLFEQYVRKNPEAAKVKAEEYGIEVNMNGLKESITGKYTMSEDLTTSNTDSLYVKFLHDVVYGDIAMEVEKYMKLVIVNEDLMKANGAGSLKIPKIYPGIATVLGEDGEIIYFGNQTTDIEITAAVRAIGTKLTWQIMKRGLDGVVKLMMRFSSNALGRKISSDIVNTLAAGATGSESGGLTYDNVIDARADVNTAKYNDIPYGFAADRLVVDAAQFASLQKSTDYKNHVYRAAILPGEKDAILNRPVQFFGDLEIVEVNILDTSVAYGLVLDSRFAAIFAKESDYISFERDLPNTFGSKEIVLGMSYGVGVLFGAAISKITS